MSVEIEPITRSVESSACSATKPITAGGSRSSISAVLVVCLVSCLAVEEKGSKAA